MAKDKFVGGRWQYNIENFFESLSLFNKEAEKRGNEIKDNASEDWKSFVLELGVDQEMGILVRPVDIRDHMFRGFQDAE